MQRITVTIEDDLVEALDGYAAQRGYQNRSEAMRDLMRAGLRSDAPVAQDEQDCIMALVYVYDHHVRELSKRLTQAFHHRHDLSLAALHVHLNEESCMEVSVLRGPGKEVRQFAQHVIAERGVRHGNIVAFPMPQDAHAPRGRHRHG